MTRSYDGLVVRVRTPRARWSVIKHNLLTLWYWRGVSRSRISPYQLSERMVRPETDRASRRSWPETRRWIDAAVSRFSAVHPSYVTLAWTTPSDWIFSVSQPFPKTSTNELPLQSLSYVATKCLYISITKSEIINDDWLDSTSPVGVFNFWVKCVG